MKTPKLLIACAALCGMTAIPAFAQGTAFTYQGVLHQNGVPANGTNDLTFTLYNAFAGGSTVGTSNVVNDLVITNGLFTVTLDFGAGAFDGAPRLLQIAVRPGASTGAYTNLEPRQHVRPTPYAMFAARTDATGVTGTVPDARLSTNVALRAGGNTFGGNQTFGNGALALMGNNFFEFGAGVAGKEMSAGKIGYELFTTGALDIVGAGTNYGGRLVQLWDLVHVGDFEANENPRLISFGDGRYVSIGENGADNRMELKAGQFEFVGGDVGIGTNAGIARLNVFHSWPYEVGVFVGDRAPFGIAAFQTDYAATNVSHAWFAENGIRVFSVRGGDGYFAGNVGIGTIAPTSRLEVDGTVTATSFVGDGSSLTGINFNNTNMARLSGGNAFAGDQTITGGSVGIGTNAGIARLNVSHSWPTEVGVFVGDRAPFGIAAFQTDYAASNVSHAWFAENGIRVFSVRGGDGYFAGSVGIGTTTPSSALQVNGTVTASAFVGDGSGLTGTVGDARLSANVALRSGGNTFTGNQTVAGNVGIGTTTPGARLHVAGSGFFGPDSGGLPVSIGAGVRAFYDGAFGGGQLYAYNYATSQATNLILQQPGGNVGIGTLAPTNKLQVNGTVAATSFVGNGSGLTGINFNNTNMARLSGGNAFAGNQTISGGRVGIGTNAGIARLNVRHSWPTPEEVGVFVGDRAPSGIAGFETDYAATNVSHAWFMENGTRVFSVRGGDGYFAGEVTCVAVNITSDRDAKEQFKPVNAREVLAKVAALPITEWQYKTQGDARHIGPMAQDFRAAFGTGRDDKHITSVDADGVALAAIQGLNELVQEQRRAIKDLEARNRQLEERLAGRLEALEKMYFPKGAEDRP